MCDAVSIGITSLVLSGIGTVANYSMGIASANQSSALANRQLLTAQQATQANVAMQNRQAMQSANQQRQQMAMQRSQLQSSQELARTQQTQQQLFGLRQQNTSQKFAMKSQLESQLFQAKQQRLQMDQAQAFQEQNQILQVEQQQEALRFQKEQAAENRNLQIEQMNAQLQDNYTRQKEAVKSERNQLMQKNETDRRLYQDRKEVSSKQKQANAAAANSVYMTEQANLDEKRKEVAFEAQSILAKSIGAKGAVLASGRTGQSVGLLVNDAERQAGVQKAQQAAMFDASKVGALIAMDNAFETNKSADMQADTQVGFAPTMPYLPNMPEVPSFVGLGIPM